MTDEGYAYFLPACLVASLGDANEARRAADCIIRNYIPSGLSTKSVDALSPDQLKLLCDWFDWIIQELEEEWRDYFSENRVHAPGATPEAIGEEIASLRDYVAGWRFTV